MFKKILLSLILIYAILGFFIIPYFAKPELLKIIESQTNAKVKLQSIYFNPFIFRLKLSNLEIQDKKNNSILALDAIIVDVEPHSLINSTLHLKTLLLQEPKISLIYSKDKILNVQTIIKESKEKPKKEEKSDFKLPRIVVDRIAIVDGTLNYQDFSKKNKFEFSFDDIGFELKDVDTKQLSKKDATLRFYTALYDGGFFDLKSEIINFEPFILKGSVDFEASKLYTQYRYMQDELKLEVADGKIDFNANYYVNLDKLDETTINISHASISKLRIKPKHKTKDILNLHSLTLKDATIKPMQQNVHLKSINLDYLAIKAKRDRNKNIDWLGYIKSDTKEQPKKEKKTDKEKSTKPWSLLIDDISLEKISVDFDDKGVYPRVKTKINELNIHLKDVTLDGKKPLKYEMNLKLNDKFVCNSNGDIVHNVLDINSYTKCSGLDIVKFRPYIDEIAKKSLSVYDVKLKSATLGFDANVKLQDKNSQMQVLLKDANINLERVALNKRSTKERLVDFRRFKVNGIKLDTKTKDVKINKTTLQTLKIYTALTKDGTINIDNLVVVKKSKKLKKHTKKKRVKKQKPYRVRLKEFALKSSRVSFLDKTLTPSLKTTIDRIYMNVYNIDSKKRSWLRYYLSMRLNAKGSIKSKGKLRHTPLKNISTLNIDKVSLKEFSPYIEKEAYLKLDDGYLNLKTNIQYAKSTLDADLQINGDINIKEFFLNDSRDNSTLFSFNDLKLNSFDLETSPDRAFVNELDIDGFYVNALIDEKKVMNFTTLSKAKKTTDANTTKTQDKNATQFPFKIMKIKVSSGSAKFADLSLPIKFKTDIHDLNGVIYSITNAKNEVSYIDIDGEIDKYGSTKLKGSIDGSNPKSYTDLNLNFRNLALNSLSGYSASFAGYKIDDGKLFLDLGYEIIDSKLLGKNSIIIKKIKLGDEIKDENTSSLPLGFAIALLEDGDGIIDIDMPVEGNVDAPDFKYGALVWKTFGNLILKAVASPFKFLGSMMGIKGDELEYIEFEKGLAIILPPEREKLDKIIKMMIKRPKIDISITPQYDEEQDSWVLKKQKLTKLIMQKSGVKNAQEHQNSVNIDILEDIYTSLAPNKDPKLIKKELSKKYKGEILNRYYLNKLYEESTKLQKLTTTELSDLAHKRANLIKEYLVNNGGINMKRVKIKKIKSVSKEKDNWVKSKLEILIN